MTQETKAFINCCVVNLNAVKLEPFFLQFITYKYPPPLLKLISLVLAVCKMNRFHVFH